MIHRQNNVLKTSAANLPDFAGSYTVTALPVGAVAAAASAGTTATVDNGHGFRAGDKVLIYDGTTATYVAEALASVTGTTLVWSSATPTIANGNLLCNLGPDSGAGSTPAYTASPMFIFSDAAGDDAITNSRVTTDASGNYDYYTAGDGRNWELIRDSGGTVAGVVDGWGGVAGRLNICDFGCIGNDSTNNQPRMQVTQDACVAAALDFYGPPGIFRMTASLKLDANFKAINSPQFMLKRAWASANSSTQSAMVVSRAYSTAAPATEARNDNIWWQGGRCTVVDTTNYGGSMFGLWSDNGVLKDVVIEEWGSNTIKGFAALCYGDAFHIDNIHAYSTVTAIGGSDGIGWAAGTGGKISNCHVQSGDDCYSMHVWESGPAQNFSTLHGEIVNCTGVSSGGRLLAIAQTGTSGDIEYINVNNLSGTAAGPLLVLTIQNAASTGSIRNVAIKNISGVSDSDVSGDRIAHITNLSIAGGVIEDVTIDGLRSDASATSLIVSGQAIYVSVCSRVRIINSDIDARSIHAAVSNLVTFHDSDDCKFTNNDVRLGGVVSTGPLFVVQCSLGSVSASGGIVSGNRITGMGDNTSAFVVPEGSGWIVSDNNVTLHANVTRATTAANGPVRGYVESGGTVEGDNVVVGNNFAAWLALEAADIAAASTALTNLPITTLDEGDCLYESNLGYNPAGVEAYTAVAGSVQGSVPVRAKYCYITVGAEDDGITLPYAAPGREIIIVNLSTANDLKMWPCFGDNINGVGVNTAAYLLNAVAPVSGPTSVRLVARDSTNWATAGGEISNAS